MKKVLVYGWYYKGNIGDDLFIHAFRRLFPNLILVFTDTISEKRLENVDAVFFGGGSFLLDPPSITGSFDRIWNLLKSKKIFYLGVGVELDIHPLHEELMSIARLIAIRTPDQVERVKVINPNTRFTPDLVYSLQSQVSEDYRKLPKSVLIMPNVVVVPQTIDPHWKHAAWAYFKSEFSQFMDWLVEEGYAPSLFSMCRNRDTNDEWAAYELIAHMKNRDHRFLQQDRPLEMKFMSEIISRHDLVITQRFHGIVLAEMARKPYITIHHHDKLKFSSPNDGAFLSYYNCSKRLLMDTFINTLKMNYSTVLPIESDIFETFSKEVMSLI